MTRFVAPTEEILFSLREVARARDLKVWDDTLAQDILSAFGAFAEGEIAPLDEPGDRQGCCLENGRVRMPAGFRAAYQQLAQMGWQGLTAPEAYGGMGQGALVAAMVSEVFSGANHAFQMICNLVPGAISTLLRFGTEDQRREWIPRLVSGEALSTMCLTEPQAGSDLSQIRTRATASAEGWRLAGEKIFISGGDQDLSDDILHLVLARTGTLEEGVKGLSLFLTSRGKAGSSIKVARIEEKLGLHASPTCHLVFQDTPAELVGVEGEGLKAMFILMNHARLDVALQGVAHASRAHAIASAYARERRQGRSADGRLLTLFDHPDVRRMLNEQHSLAVGARAMAHIALVEMVRGDAPELVDFLTPVCKVFCSEAGIKSADLGIQVLGGYGYLPEYRVSQTWRDARITSIYEGANGIHALATATRGLKVGGGAGADAFDALIGKLTDHPHVLGRREVWRKARAVVLESDQPAFLAHDFMQLTSGLFYQAAWARIAQVTRSEELLALAELVLAPERKWMT